MARRTPRIQLAFLLALGWMPGCERDPEVPPPTAPSALEPVDPDMLLEGPVAVFGLRMPEGASLRGQHISAASLAVQHPMEKVSSYVRAKVVAASVETGPDKTVFVGARRIGSSPSDPTFKIVVTRSTFGTELLINVEPRRGPFPTHARPPSSADMVGAPRREAPLPVPASVASLLPKAPPPPPEDPNME